MSVNHQEQAQEMPPHITESPSTDKVAIKNAEKAGVDPIPPADRVPNSLTGQ